MTTPTEQWANVPSWQIQELENLSSQGLLSGVDPHILAAIDQAESSGSGGGINPEGYGGFFGLGSNTAYPGGSTTPGLLSSTSPQAFDAQAELAGSEFASLLASHGNNAYAAESAYQGGSSEGTGIFTSLGIPGTDAGTQANLAVDLNPFSGGSNPVGAAGSAAVSSLFPNLNTTSLATRLLLVLVGLILLAIGVNKLFDKSAPPSQVVMEGGSQAGAQAGQARDWASTKPKQHAEKGRSLVGDYQTRKAAHAAGRSQGRHAAKGTPFKAAKGGAEDVGETAALA